MGRPVSAVFSHDLRQAAAALTALAVALALAVTPGTAAAQGGAAPTIAGDHLLGESPDYATEQFGDPWDYQNSDDIQTDPGPVINIDTLALANGRLGMDMSATGHFHPIWPGFPGGLRLGRDGPANPVDASRYTTLSFRLYSTSFTVGSIAWQNCPDITDGCEGQVGFEVLPIGWQTISVDLRTGGGATWSGLLQALRFTLAVPQPTRFEMDWMRLHGQANAARINLGNSAGGDTTLFWDADSDLGNNTVDNPGWGEMTSGGDRGTFDVAAYPAGAYRFYTRRGQTTSSYSQPLVIEAAPRIRILNPDIAGGEDFATAVLGDPWDFSNAEDVVEMGNIINPSFADGQLHGNNGGANPRDPYVVLSGIGDLDADRYHRFTVRMTYEGAFDLSWDPGGGTHGRISWRQDGHHLWQQTAEVVNYPSIDTYTVVMGVDPAGSIMEPDLGQPGWGTGAQTHELRWDINEDIGPKRWHLDNIRLAADDESFGAFTIQWADDGHQAGTTISLFVDSDNQGFDGQPIASGITTTADVNSLAWNTSGVTPGEYWVYAVASSPGGTATSRTYATGPVQVRPSTGNPDVEPDGLRLAGADRIATSIQLSRAGFPGIADTAIIARASAFPDALAAAPLAAAIGAPLLLNGMDSLSPAVRAELERLQVGRVILLGGTAAQSAAVEAELRGFVEIVDRADGEDRFHTASIIAERSVQEWAIRGHQAGPPLVALGSRFEDALAAASMAGHERRPLLLTNPDSVPAWTARSLSRLGASSATVVGGRGIILPSLMDGLRGLVGQVDELAGADHVETAALAARRAVLAGARGDIVVVASGDAFPDALAAGPSAIAQGGVLLLTPRDSLGAATEAFLGDTRISRMSIAGGHAAVSPQIGAALARVARIG